MTKDFTNRGMCQAKKGMLFLRDCGETALAQCHLCGRPICEKHQVPSEKGPQCPECVARSTSENDTSTTVRGSRMNPVGRARFRSSYYDRYGYMPYYFGHHHSSYYSDRDYRTFDEVSNEEALAAQEAMDSADDVNFQDLDDFMES